MEAFFLECTIFCTVMNRRWWFDLDYYAIVWSASRLGLLALLPTSLFCCHVLHNISHHGVGISKNTSINCSPSQHAPAAGRVSHHYTVYITKCTKLALKACRKLNRNQWYVQLLLPTSLNVQNKVHCMHG